MAEFPELPMEGDTIEGPEQDVPEQDFMTQEEAEADETVDVGERDE